MQGTRILDKLEGNRASAKVVQFIKYLCVNCLLSEVRNGYIVTYTGTQEHRNFSAR